eukprot:3405109-Rhodomonas_salina.1
MRTRVCADGTPHRRVLTSLRGSADVALLCANVTSQSFSPHSTSTSCMDVCVCVCVCGDDDGVRRGERREGACGQERRGCVLGSNFKFKFKIGSQTLAVGSDITGESAGLWVLT